MARGRGIKVSPGFRHNRKSQSCTEAQFLDNSDLTLSDVLERKSVDAGSPSKGWAGMLGQWSGPIDGKMGVS